MDGFYTKLDDVFVLDNIGNDTQGNLLKERRNGSGATVKGVNLELKVNPARWMQLQGGFTIQSSRYKNPETWIEDDATIAPTKKLLRTPDYYGYLTSNFNITKQFLISVSGVYTGRMYIPHLEGYIDENRLEHTKDFFDAAIRLSYDIKLTKQITMQINGGVRNIFNSFQKDFDKGMNRDAGYMYGPGLPRTFFMGVKLGQF